MKRLFLVFALAGVFTACNNSADTTNEKKDSLDSMASERKDVVDSSAQQQKEMIDSTTDKKKEALDRADSIRRADSLHKKSK